MTAICGWHRKRDRVEVAPDGLIVTTGSQQALDLLGKTLISPGDKVIVEGPDLPRDDPVLSSVWRAIDQRADRCRWRKDRRAREVDRRTPAEVRPPDSDFRQPERRHAEPGAAPQGAGSRRQVPDAGGR